MAQVLVIDADEWVAQMVVDAIREAGHEVIACSTARDGFDLACAMEPDCIVCDMRLPDHDGAWVAKCVRAQDSEVSVVPFVFFSRSEDVDTGVEGFRMGADVMIQKPFRLDEVMGQIEALLKMSRRFRETRQRLTGRPPGMAFDGALTDTSVRTLLGVLEMERRSGSLVVEGRGIKIEVTLASGSVAEASIGARRVKPLDAIKKMVECPPGGRFKFEVGPARTAPGGARLPSQLLQGATAGSAVPGPPAAAAVPNAPRPPAPRQGSKPILPPPVSTASAPTRGSDACVAGEPLDPSEPIEVEVDFDSFRPPDR